MKPKLLLHIAALLMLLHTIGHSLSAFTWDDAPNKTIANVLQAMKDNHFDFFGRQVSLASFYQGFGNEMIVVLLLISILLWLAGDFVHDTMTQKLLPWLALFLALTAADEWIYFFSLPAIMSSLACLLTLIAFYKSRKSVNPDKQLL